MPRASDTKGNEIPPNEGVVPILQEVRQGVLRLVGTGFYIARYGLFLTARHVLDELANEEEGTLSVGFILHPADADKVHLRRIVRATLMKPFDIAIGEANNYSDRFPNDPLRNRRAILTTEVPTDGSPLTTYAYPENEILDFTDDQTIPTVRSDYYKGELLRHVRVSEHPFIPYPHYETSLEIRSGASGGPVFNDRGRVVGLNCRSWEFADGSDDGDNLSYIVPISVALDVSFQFPQVPAVSWESKQLPVNRTTQPVTLRELARFGHIEFDPPLDIAANSGTHLA